jgi:hypothetical protein
MKRSLTIMVAAVALAGCGGSVPAAVPNDDAYHARAVAFQTQYAELHHVRLSAAQCVWPLTTEAGGWLTDAKVMAMNPRRTPFGDCTH